MPNWKSPRCRAFSPACFPTPWRPRQLTRHVESFRRLFRFSSTIFPQVLAISCDHVSVTVPWSSLRSRPLRVKIGHVRAQATAGFCHIVTFFNFRTGESARRPRYRLGRDACSSCRSCGGKARSCCTFPAGFSGLPLLSKTSLMA